MESRAAFRALSISALVFSTTAASDPQIVISSDLPSDIPGGANNATLTAAAEFAWQEFIALNWPAQSGTRDVPDETAKFGDSNFTGPLVWHTYRHKVEIYPGQGSPNGLNDTASDFGYSTLPPKYTYGTGAGDNGNGQVPACEGQTPVSEPAFINADEISQIGLDSMFAGTAPDNVAGNSEPQLIRFLAKGNKSHFMYAVDGEALEPQGDPLYTHPKPCPTDTSDSGYDHTYCVAQRNLQAVSQSNGATTELPGITIEFPDGTIMAKGAWRELTADEMQSGRFYTTPVRYYEDSGDGEHACYREAEWGMVAMHIIHKTPSAPTFVFATYEQADALLTQGGDPVEDENGDEVNDGGQTSSTTPALAYQDGTPPMLSIVGSDYCTTPGDRLFYQENPDKTGLPSDGSICQNFRNNPIPSPVSEVNQAAHQAIQAYNQQNGIADSPWLYYRLTNVQAEPFDRTDIDADNADGNRSLSVFYLSDIVIETDYTLQQFSGRIDPTGPPTALPPNFDNFNPQRQTYQNVLTFDNDTLHDTFNMGGCMGCHGVAQLGGNDFSFILGGGRVAEPDAPRVTPPGTSNPTPITEIKTR